MVIVAWYDGSTHDSRIFWESKRTALFLQGVYTGMQYYLLVIWWLLFKIAKHQQNSYKMSQIRTRNVIERFFGVWKRCFPVMASSLLVKLVQVFPIITATLVLNNIAWRSGEKVPSGFEITLSVPWEELLA